MSDADLNLSTDMAISNTKQFLRTMAQPTDPKDQEGVSVWSYENLIKHQNSRKIKVDLLENETKKENRMKMKMKI